MRYHFYEVEVKDGMTYLLISRQTLRRNERAHDAFEQWVRAVPRVRGEPGAVDLIPGAYRHRPV